MLEDEDTQDEDTQVSDYDDVSDGEVVEPRMEKTNTFWTAADIFLAMVDGLDKYALGHPEPAEHHRPQIEVDEYGIETIYTLCLNNEGLV